MVPAMLPTQRNTTHTVRAMHEIICPHCSKAFKIDEAGYADILKQVRDGEFEQALHERLELAEREKRDAIALAEAKVTNALQGATVRKDAEIQALEAQLAEGEVVRKLAVTEALDTVSKERDGLANALNQARNAQHKLLLSWPRPSWPKRCKRLPPERMPEIQALQAKLEAGDVERDEVQVRAGAGALAERGHHEV